VQVGLVESLHHPADQADLPRCQLRPF
jgi:hypothetical protein